MSILFDNMSYTAGIQHMQHLLDIILEVMGSEGDKITISLLSLPLNAFL